MAELSDDIRKYLSGELTPAERNALERKAMSDPFLADALEGGESFSYADFSNDIQSLQTSLQQRIKKDQTKVVSLWTWSYRVAAAILILAVAFIAFNKFGDDRSSSQLADNKKTESAQTPTSPKAPDSTFTESITSFGLSTDTSASGALAPTKTNELSLTPPPHTHKAFAAGARGRSDDDSLKRANESATTPASSTAGLLFTQPQDVFSEKAEGYFSKDTVMDSISIRLQGRVAGVDVASAEEVTVLKPVPNNESAAEEDKSLSRDAASAKGSARKAKRTARFSEEADTIIPQTSPAEQKAIASEYSVRALDETKYVVRGKVTSAEDGNVLPGVNVMIKGTNFGTVTDGEGNYEIPVDEAAPTLMFSFIGMEDKEVKIQDVQEMNVALVNDMKQLSEVVVVGYGGEKMEDEIPGRIEFATPTVGRAEFKKYLESNLRYPQQALVNDIEGKVTIQFTVQTSGELSEFKIVRGIGYGCDDEVIRLIKNGPKWNPTRKDSEPVTGRIKVRVRFKLPKHK